MKINRRFFISVEGIDGAGKSTHVDFIQKYLQHEGLEVIVTREPGGTQLGEAIRNLLLHTNHMHQITELLLLFASRQELIGKLIMPNLDRGISVIADRFIDASIAYQAMGRGIGLDKVNRLISILEPQIQTDLTFIFDVPVDLAFKRVSRHKNKDRIENESREFFSTVQQAYYRIAQAEPQRVKLISTDNPIEKTQLILAGYLADLLHK